MRSTGQSSPTERAELLASAQAAYWAACESGGVVFNLADEDHVCQALNLLSPAACDALDRALALYGPEEVQG